MSIEIANESGAPADAAALAALARHVLDELRIHPFAELSVLLVDEPAMTELHVRWMGEPGPTDVLAFPMDELRPPQPGGGRADPAAADPEGIPGLLGDVVICPQVAAAQARQAGLPVADELELLTVHGILHLLGYDHADAAEHATMFGLQDRLIASWRADRAAGQDGPAGAAADTGQDAAAGPDGVAGDSDGTPAERGGAAQDGDPAQDASAAQDGGGTAAPGGVTESGSAAGGPAAADEPGPAGGAGGSRGRPG